MSIESVFEPLVNYLSRVPAIKTPIATGIDNELWWVKFQIDIEHPLAWHVVQELGCVVNYLSIEERLPTVFYPVSPAPYLNGGPGEYLSWIIKTMDSDFHPETLMQWLEGRLPNPVNELSEWDID